MSCLIVSEERRRRKNDGGGGSDGGGGGGGGRSRESAIKNKNPTQRCGEQQKQQQKKCRMVSQKFAVSKLHHACQSDGPKFKNSHVPSFRCEGIHACKKREVHVIVSGVAWYQRKKASKRNTTVCWVKRSSHECEFAQCNRGY